MRAENSLKNAAAAWSGQLLSLVIKFVSRTIFVMILSEEYLGVNGLFSNILSMLSLAELGVGVAIVYSMYRPIAQNDEEKIIALMQFYKKVYTAIGIFILVVGSCLTPFLSVFVKEMPDIEYLQVIYLLYVLNSGASYFFSYKASFITANQKNYIVTIINNLMSALTVTAQIIVLAITKNFILYVAVQVVGTVITNAVISWYANKHYPVLKKKEKKPLEEATLNEIKKNTKAMLMHKIGGIIVFSTDNIILSKFVGLAVVGIYSNYVLLIESIEKVLEQIFFAITPGIGNLAVCENEDRSYDVFKTTFLINFWVYSFSAICFFNLMNPFISLWLSEKYLFAFGIVTILCINFYIKGMRKTVQTFSNAMGLFWYNRYVPLFESVINIVFSIVLSLKLGAAGVFIGTFISTMTTCFIAEPWVVFKYGLNKKMRLYMIKYAIFTVVGLATNALVYFLCGLATGDGIMPFVLKMLVCAVVPNVVYIIVFARTNEFKYILSVIKRITKKIFRR